MIDDLLRRIDRYRSRIAKVHERWEEASDEGDDIFTDDTYNREPSEEMVFDAETEIIGSRAYWEKSWGLKPLRYTVSPDNPWYFDIDGVVFSRETGLLIRFPPGKCAEYTIPDDERITGIGSSAFADNPMLRRIHLNDRIQYIGSGAFMNCQALEEIRIPSSVEYVGIFAMEGCTALKKAELAFRANSIPDRFLNRAASLVSVEYPAHITSIGHHAFAGCRSLESMKPADLENASADVVLSRNIREVKREAFSGCEKICSVSLPDGLTTITRWLFKGCRSLQMIGTDSVEEYQGGCFQDCGSLEHFTFSSRTRSLGTELFTGAENLKTIHFSCTSDFICKDYALPEYVQYDVDAEAYLSVRRPYSCLPLLFGAVRKLAYGETVSPAAEKAAVKTLKRNHAKLHSWFIKDEQSLEWILQASIPNCDDCVDMVKLTETTNQRKTDLVLAWMTAHFQVAEIEEARKRWEKQDRERKEKEQREQEEREEQERREAIVAARAAAGEDLTLEEMGISQKFADLLKEKGITMMSQVVKTDYYDLWKICHNQSVANDIKNRAAFLRNGGKEQEDDEWEFSLSDLEDLFRNDDI